MNESALQGQLRSRFPKENAACEWKEFKNLTHAVSARKGEDIASYVSAIANMQGGYLVVGVEDATLRIVGIQNLADYTPENIRQRLLAKCTNLDSEEFYVEPLTADDTQKKRSGYSTFPNTVRLCQCTPMTKHGSGSMMPW